MSVKTAINQGVDLDQVMLSDVTHTHKQNIIKAHLDLLDFISIYILTKGELWLVEDDVDNIWRIMVSNSSNQADKDMTFTWFRNCLARDNFDPETYRQVYGKLVSYPGPRTSSYNSATAAFKNVQGD